MSNWSVAAERVGLIAVVLSLLFVGYEVKRNTDLAVVESQQELLVLNVEMKGWFLDEDIRRILLADDINQLQKDELQTLVYLAGSWFDLHEHALLGYQRGVLSDEQMRVWSAGLCTFPPLWFEIFHTHINQNNYLDSLVSAVTECESALQTK